MFKWKFCNWWNFNWIFLLIFNCYEDKIQNKDQRSLKAINKLINQNLSGRFSLYLVLK